jgi:MFS transporter, NNP family, nitrate/nitrite transporter
MNDIADAKASFAEQAVIFQRKHNWIMCWLYTGTFGSFIGYSAGFPLLAQDPVPEVNSLQFVFLGPLVGALARAATGWVSDKYGGGRVTFWVFVGMIAAVLGVIYFLGIKDAAGAFWGFFAMLHGAVLRDRRRQRLDLPDDPGDHAPGDRPADAVGCERGGAAPGDREESAAIIGFTSAIAPTAPSSSPRPTAPRSP